MGTRASGPGRPIGLFDELEGDAVLGDGLADRHAGRIGDGDGSEAQRLGDVRPRIAVGDSDAQVDIGIAAPPWS